LSNQQRSEAFDRYVDAVNKLVELTKIYYGGQARVLWSSWD
jgi:hypothetical protein